ncbi:MAG: NUDIX hydrolase [Thermoanaerobaculia bacterium]
MSARTVYDGSVLRLEVEEVRLPNGAVVELELIRHRGAAAVVPLDADGEVLLVRQYRHAANGSWLLEVPAGKLEGGEPPAECARRELEEEAGARAGRLDALGWIWTTPGFTDERIWLFLARDLEMVPPAPEADEALEVVRMPFAELVRMALDGTLTDGKTICAVLRAAERLNADEVPW